MKPILYPADETNFTTNGLGRLSDAIKCTVIEERNGQYELEMNYPVSGIHYADIAEERIIYARHDDAGDLQPFVIYQITRPMNGVVTVLARHISCQLSKVVVMPMTAPNISAAFSGMKTNSVGDNPFSWWTDKTSVATFKVEQPTSFRALLGGTRGSILDTYGGGEYEWDKFTIKLHAHRGSDSGVTIRYGKNLTDVKKVSDASGIWTGIVPFWHGTSDDSSSDVTVTLPEKAVYASTASSHAYAMVIPVDFSSDFDTAPTAAQLRAKAQSYINANVDTAIPTSIDISFVALWQTEEYKNVAPLQRLKLCDTVTVHHGVLGIDHTAKIVSVTYDVLLERYSSMTVGEMKTNLEDSIAGIASNVSKEASQTTTTYLEKAINHATQLITGGLGGYVYLKPNADGQPEEILILGDSPDITQATQVWRWNKNGLGHSSTGYNGNYSTAITADGHIVADVIDTGTLNAALITVTHLSASSIDTGTMVADRILGGLLRLGGLNNGYGAMEVYDSSDREIGSLDRDGLALIGYISNGVQARMVLTEARMEFQRLINSEYVSTLTMTGGYAGGSPPQASVFVPLINPLTSGIDRVADLTVNDTLTFRATPETSTSIVEDVNGNTGLEYQVLIGGVQTGRQRLFLGDGLICPNHATNYMSNCYIRTLKADGLTVTGTKSRVAETDDYSNRLLYCYETASPMFGDVGEGAISEDGKCYIQIDPIFAETITTRDYQVFLQKYGEGECWVSERTGGYFVVTGTPGLSFGWELKAKQAGYTQTRLDTVKPYVVTDNRTDYAGEAQRVIADSRMDYAAQAQAHIDQIYTERGLSA